MFQEMELAGILHKAVSFDPPAVPAEDVLEMATISGAKALVMRLKLVVLLLARRQIS